MLDHCRSVLLLLLIKFFSSSHMFIVDLRFALFSIMIDPNLESRVEINPRKNAFLETASL